MSTAKSRLHAVEKRIAEVEAEICKQMYCGTIEEALALAGASVIKHEQHIITLSDERAELVFLKLRKGQLEAEIAKVAA